MRYNMVLFSLIVLSGCATSKVAKDLQFVGFEEKPAATQAGANIEGRDCKWSAFGYRIGDEPSVRKAFQNAVEQKDGNFLPGEELKKGGTDLKAIRNASVEQTGFNVWVVGRTCMVVTGVGYR